MDEFWDGETSASLRAVDVYITRIRDKMSVSDDFKITTVHGLGYKAVRAHEQTSVCFEEKGARRRIPRVRRRLFSWRMFAMTLLVVSVLSAGKRCLRWRSC